MDMIIKTVKHAELNTKIASAFLDTQTLKIVWQNTNVYVAIRIIKKSFMKP